MSWRRVLAVTASWLLVSQLPGLWAQPTIPWSAGTAVIACRTWAQTDTTTLQAGQSNLHPGRQCVSWKRATVSNIFFAANGEPVPNGSESTDDEIIEPAQMLELTWAQTSRRPTASRKPRRRRGRSRQQEGTVSSLEGSSGSFNVSSSASWETFVDATDAMCLSLNRGLEFCVPIQAFWHDQRALLHSALTAFCASQEAEPVVAGMRGDARQCETAIADELVQRRFLERPTAAEESVLRQPLFQGTLVGHRVHISEAQLAVGETKMESGGSEVCEQPAMQCTSTAVLLLDFPALGLPHVMQRLHDILGGWNTSTPASQTPEKDYAWPHCLTVLVEQSPHIGNNVEDILQSVRELVLNVEVIFVQAELHDMSSVSEELKHSIRVSAFATAMGSISRRIDTVLVLMPLHYLTSQKETHPRMETLATSVAMCGAVRWKAECTRAVAGREVHAVTLPPVDLVLSVVSEGSVPGYGSQPGTRRPERASLVLRTIASLRQTFEGRISVVTSSASLIRDMLVRQGRPELAQLHWAVNLHLNSTVESYVRVLPTFVFYSQTADRKYQRSSEPAVLVFVSSAQDVFVRRRAWRSILAQETAVVTAAEFEAFARSHWTSPEQGLQHHGYLAENFDDSRPGTVPVRNVRYSCHSRIRLKHLLEGKFCGSPELTPATTTPTSRKGSLFCSNYEPSLLPHGPRLSFTPGITVWHVIHSAELVDCHSFRLKVFPEVNPLMLDTQDFRAALHQVAVTKKDESRPLVGFLWPLQPFGWATLNNNVGSRHTWAAICGSLALPSDAWAQTASTYNPRAGDWLSLLGALRSALGDRGSQTALIVWGDTPAMCLSTSATGPELPRFMGVIELNSVDQVVNHLLAVADLASAPLQVFFPNGSELVLNHTFSNSEHEANTSSDGSIVMVKTHKTGTETMKSIFLDVASVNGWTVLDIRGHHLEKLCDSARAAPTLTRPELRHRFDVSVGHIPLNNWTKKCLDLLLRPPVRYITALRNPQRRSESHFRFDNTFSQAHRRVPHAESSDLNNWTYSEWYATFGADRHRQHAGWEESMAVETIWVNNHMARYIGALQHELEINSDAGSVEREGQLVVNATAFLNQFQAIFLTEFLDVCIDLFLCSHTSLFTLSQRRFLCNNERLRRLNNTLESIVGSLANDGALDLHDAPSTATAIHAGPDLDRDDNGDTPSLSSVRLNTADDRSAASETRSWAVANKSVQALFRRQNGLDFELFFAARERLRQTIREHFNQTLDFAHLSLSSAPPEA